MKHFTDFTEWKAAAELIGWVHVHDDFVVCDDESGFVLGEFAENDELQGGWLIEDVIQEMEDW